MEFRRGVLTKNCGSNSFPPNIPFPSPVVGILKHWGVNDLADEITARHGDGSSGHTGGTGGTGGGGAVKPDEDVKVKVVDPPPSATTATTIGWDQGK